MRYASESSLTDITVRMCSGVLAVPLATALAVVETVAEAVAEALGEEVVEV